MTTDDDRALWISMLAVDLEHAPRNASGDYEFTVRVLKEGGVALYLHPRARSYRFPSLGELVKTVELLELDQAAG